MRWTEADSETAPDDGWYWSTWKPAQEVSIIEIRLGYVSREGRATEKRPAISWAEFAQGWCGWYAPANYPGPMDYPKARTE